MMSRFRQLYKLLWIEERQSDIWHEMLLVSIGRRDSCDRSQQDAGDIRMMFRRYQAIARRKALPRASAKCWKVRDHIRGRRDRGQRESLVTST